MLENDQLKAKHPRNYWIIDKEEIPNERLY